MGVAAAFRSAIGSCSQTPAAGLKLRVGRGNGRLREVLGGGVAVQGRRYKSGPYGYTQAKALVYSKYGEPKDVLSYVSLSSLLFLHTHLLAQLRKH